MSTSNSSTQHRSSSSRGLQLSCMCCIHTFVCLHKKQPYTHWGFCMLAAWAETQSWANLLALNSLWIQTLVTSPTHGFCLSLFAEELYLLVVVMSSTSAWDLTPNINTVWYMWENRIGGRNSYQSLEHFSFDAVSIFICVRILPYFFVWKTHWKGKRREVNKEKQLGRFASSCYFRCGLHRKQGEFSL